MGGNTEMNMIGKVPAPVELTVQHEKLTKKKKGVILIKHERGLGKKCKVLREHIAKIINLL